MTISPGDPGPVDPEAGGTPVPPYEGRREAADVDDEESARREGAAVGGATGPAESGGRTSPDPETTRRGPVASPADEQPAADVDDEDADPGEASTGPAHRPGTPRGEDRGGVP